MRSAFYCKWRERRGSNSRPHAWQACALTKLSYAPIYSVMCLLYLLKIKMQPSFYFLGENLLFAYFCLVFILGDYILFTTRFCKTVIPNVKSPTQISKFHILFNLKFFPPSWGRVLVGADFNLFLCQLLYLPYITFCNSTFAIIVTLWKNRNL